MCEREDLSANPRVEATYFCYFDNAKAVLENARADAELA